MKREHLAAACAAIALIGACAVIGIRASAERRRAEAERFAKEANASQAKQSTIEKRWKKLAESEEAKAAAKDEAKGAPGGSPSPSAEAAAPSWLAKVAAIRTNPRAFKVVSYEPNHLGLGVESFVLSIPPLGEVLFQRKSTTNFEIDIPIDAADASDFAPAGHVKLLSPDAKKQIVWWRITGGPLEGLLLQRTLGTWAIHSRIAACSNVANPALASVCD